MRNLLDDASVAQCLDEEPSDGETACPHGRNLIPRLFRRKFHSRGKQRERSGASATSFGWSVNV